MGIIEKAAEAAAKRKAQAEKSEKERQDAGEMKYQHNQRRAIAFIKSLDLPKVFVAVLHAGTQVDIRLDGQCLVSVSFHQDSVAQYVGDGEYTGQGESFDVAKIRYATDFLATGDQEYRRRTANAWDNFYPEFEHDMLELGEYLGKRLEAK